MRVTAASTSRANYCSTISTCAQATAHSWAQDALLSASSMMRRIVRAQRPHCGLHPRHPYTWLAVAGRAGALSRADRTSRSLKTLQEQTIISKTNDDPVDLALI
jgi:predicted RNA polymerase sigma factor